MHSVKVGDPIIYADQKGRHLSALVIENWGQNSQGEDQRATWEEGEVGPTINIAFVDPNPAKKDGYGRQLKRETSVCHKSGSTAPGFWWCLPEELA